MKKVLLASTALVLSAGVAAADVSVGGDGRMGMISTGGSDLGFTSRIRISFSASGETDAGLQFGGSVRVDNYESDQATVGTEGSVFVSGTFGTISMGDVAGAPEAAVGDLSGVGLTGLGDYNEFFYLSNNPDFSAFAASTTSGVAARPAARWDYTVADLGIHVSADQPSDIVDTYGIAVTYSMGDISFGLGYENMDVPGGSIDHTIAGVTAGLGDATIKAIYGTADVSGGANIDQYGLSLDFVSGATTFTAFYRTIDIDTVGDANVYGLGVSYDLGGGAALKAGYVDGDDIGIIDASGTGVPVTNATFGDPLSDASYDFGISMSF